MEAAICESHEAVSVYRSVYKWGNCRFQGSENKAMQLTSEETEQDLRIHC